MENLIQKAKELRQAGKFNEAVELYKKLYDDESIDLNNWDIWSYAHCLRKSGQLDKSIEISEKYIVEYSDFEQLKSNLVWAYFDKYFRHFDSTNINKAEKALSKIYELNGQQKISDSNQIPCPFTIGVFRVLKHYKKPNFNNFKIRFWIDKINSDNLSKVEQTMEQDGKERQLASDYEKYYAILIPLLFNEKNYETCIKVVDHALETTPSLHYSNAKWFKRKKALSFFELGDLEKSEEILESLGDGRDDKWFIDHELSVIYFEQGDYEKSLEFAIKAAKGQGEDIMKVNLYTHLARIFYKLGKPSESESHAKLVVAIKQANNLNFDNNQNRLLSYFSIDIKEIINLKNQKRIVEAIWNKVFYKGQNLLEGIIMKILPNGKSGFIKEKNSASYYFSLKSLKGNRRKVKEGSKVRFYLQEGFDKKKNTKTMNAVEIKIID